MQTVTGYRSQVAGGGQASRVVPALALAACLLPLTAAAAPTNAPPAGSRALMVATNNVIVAPTNAAAFRAANAIPSTNETAALAADIAALVGTQTVHRTWLEGLTATQGVLRAAVTAGAETGATHTAQIGALTDTQGVLRAAVTANAETGATHTVQIAALVGTQAVHRTWQEALTATQTLVRATQDVFRAAIDANTASNLNDNARLDALESGGGGNGSPPTQPDWAWARPRDWSAWHTGHGSTASNAVTVVGYGTAWGGATNFLDQTWYWTSSQTTPNDRYFYLQLDPPKTNGIALLGAFVLSTSAGSLTNWVNLVLSDGVSTLSTNNLCSATADTWQAYDLGAAMPAVWAEAAPRCVRDLGGVITTNWGLMIRADAFASESQHITIRIGAQFK